ncbi:MAG: hypothetical protein HKN23_19055 [Verrucomicrobiales bacterium]|nr:hypothetical protein [Verrucomicrobiales bacterium]
MESLRTETIEDVKILSQLNRLKITLVTGTAAVAFGLAPSTPVGDLSPLMLCLAPLVCLYCDCQYYHHLAKIFARAAFFRRFSDSMTDVQVAYEKFMREVRMSISPKLFSFETTAQLGSSVVLSIFVPLLGIPYMYLGQSQLSGRDKIWVAGILLGAVILGLVLTLTYFSKYSSSLKMLRDAESQRIGADSTVAVPESKSEEFANSNAESGEKAE